MKNVRLRTRSRRPISDFCWHFGIVHSILALGLLASFPDAAIGMQLLSPSAAPIDPQASAPIRKLLADQWDRDPANEANSRRIFSETRRDNPNLLLAYALNRLQHNRVDEAKAVTSELTTDHQDNLDGWMLQAWLNTLTNKYDVALVNLRSLKKQLDKNQKLPPATQLAIYKRAGRLIGFMQGPVKDRVNADLLDGTVLAVTGGLAPEILKLFNENRERVLKQYESLLQSQGQRTQAELAKVKIENDNETIALDREIQMLERTESQLIPEKQQLRQEATQQISTLQQQAAGLEQQLVNVSNDILETEQDLQFMFADLYNAQNLPPRFRPPLFYLQNQIRTAQLSLSILRNNGNQISNQLGLLRAQIVQTQNAFNQRLSAIDKEIKRINGAKRRNLARLSRLAAGPKMAEGKQAAMQSKVTALRTYDELPLVLYRQELLEKLTDK